MVQTVSPVTLLTSCLDTYRPDCSADQSVVREDNNAELISTLSNVSKVHVCNTLENNNHSLLLGLNLLVIVYYLTILEIWPLSLNNNHKMNFKMNLLCA